MPVLSVIEYGTFDQAMGMLNGTEFGPSSALFSNSSALVRRFFAESRHGMMHVDHGLVPDSNVPFGSIENSGACAYYARPPAGNFCTSEHTAYFAR